MAMYNKLYTKILDSSIWLEPNPTRIVWITFLAAMDEDGFAQFSSVRNLANRAMVTPEEAEKAVATLESPDKESASKDHDGRRIERVPGGWMILNASLYRDIVTRTEKLRLNRERVARHRAKKKNGNAVGNAPVMQSESYTNAGSEAEKKLRTPAASLSSTTEAIKPIFPRRAGSQPWGKADKAIKARIAAGESDLALIDGARRYAEFCKATGKIGTEYVMQAATFFGPDRRYLESWSPPASKADIRLAGNLDAAAEFMRRTENAIQ